LTPLGYSDRVEKFDLEKQVWSYVAKMPAKRSKHAACLIDSGDQAGLRIAISGGIHPCVKCDDDGSTNFWVYDVDGDVWSKKPCHKHIRSCHNLVSKGNTVYVIGGKKKSLPVEKFVLAVKNEVVLESENESDGEDEEEVIFEEKKRRQS